MHCSGSSMGWFGSSMGWIDWRRILDTRIDEMMNYCPKYHGIYPPAKTSGSRR